MSTSKHGAPPRVKPEPSLPAKPTLPAWKEAHQIRAMTIEELLLFALAGGRMERALVNPLVALAERCAADVAALHKLLGERIDDQDVADLMQGASERVAVLAAIVRLVL